MWLFGLILFALFVSLPAFLFKLLVGWAAQNGANKPIAALICIALGLTEGFIGYWLFAGINMGLTLVDGVWYQEIFRMRVVGVAAMVVGGLMTIFAPLACLSANEKTVRDI